MITLSKSYYFISCFFQLLCGLLFSMITITTTTKATLFITPGHSLESVQMRIKTAKKTELHPIVCAWDVHGVLMDVTTKQKIKCSFLHIRRFTGNYPNVLEAVIRMKKKPHKVQKYLEREAHNTYILPGAETLLIELKQKGCSHVILSNMGSSIWDICVQKIIPNNFLQLLDLPGCTLAQPMKNGNFYGPWYEKPHNAIYSLFFQKNKKYTNSIKIFVDDTVENVRAAVANGFDVGIVHKNKEQVRNDLKLLGVL